MAYSQERLESAARDFCYMLNEATGCGYDVHVDMGWNPGMTAAFRTTKRWNVRITLNNVEMVVDPDKR